MKKILFSLISICLMLSSVARADYWKTYRLEDEPNCILSVPSSHHVIYYGMPENSSVLKSIGMTARQAELQLEFNNAFALVYSDNLSCFFSIAKFDVQEDYNYNQLSETDISEIADMIGAQMEQNIEANSDMSVDILDTMTLETAFDKYAVVMSKISIGSSEQVSIQCTTVKNKIQTILSFACLNQDYFQRDVDTFQNIVENLVIL